MTLAEKYKEKYDIGFPIFKRLFDLNKSDLFKILRIIFSENKDLEELLNEKNSVIKKLEDDKPSSIEILSWDRLIITYLGIQFKHEHSSPVFIVKFDKFFNIDVAFDELEKL